VNSVLGFESMKGVEMQQQQLELGRSGESHSDSDPLLQNQADASSTQEITVNNDDIENVSVPCCRICLETDCEPGTFLSCKLLIMNS